MQLRALDGPVGAHVVGLDLSEALSGATVFAILQAFRDHQVLIFRDQHLDDTRLLDIASWFGASYHPPPGIPIAETEGTPGVLKLSSDGGAGGTVPLDAHTDLHYMPMPTLGAVLYAVEVPPTGGETSWSNQYLAWEELPAAVRTRCASLRAATPNPFAGSTARPDLTGPNQRLLSEDVPLFPHPLGRTHPETGKVALYVTAYSDHLFEDDGTPVAEREQQDLLGQLQAHIRRDDLWTTHEWQAGDLVIWDNRCTLHRRAPFDTSQARTMLRTQMAGSVPF